MPDRYFYPIALILFLLDILCFSLCEQQILFLLLCFYIATLYHEISVAHITTAIVLISLESFLYFGSFSLQLLYLIPATIIAVHAQRYFYISHLQPYLLLLSCLLIQYFLLEPMHLPHHGISSYTPIKIIANIGVLCGILLIDNSQGKLGNRLRRRNAGQEESPDS